MTIESRLAEIRARAEKLDGGLPCAWCDIPAVGLARHNDGLLNPSCGEDGHGFDWQAAGDPRTIAGALTDLPALLAAVEAVRALHQPMTPEQARLPSGSRRCFHCWDPYPCRTITALTAALEVEA